MGPIKKLFLLYLRTLAKLQLKKINPTVVGIGGASGKTSTAYLVDIVLKDKYKIRQSGGKNSETGIPLSILSISPTDYTYLDWLKISVISIAKILFDWNKYSVYICEMGIDSPKEPKNMTYLLKILKPDIGILTSISYEHSEYFDPYVKSEKDRKEEILELTRKEEMLLLQSVSKNGWSVVNLDDEEISKGTDGIVSKKLTVSKKERGADFYIQKIEKDVNNFGLTFVYKSKVYSLSIGSPLTDNYTYSFIFAIAVGAILNIPVEECTKSIENNFSLPPGRLSIFSGIKNTTIIDSSYNSSLPPLLDALNLLKDISKNRRKVAILGDMRELGILSKKFHEEAADKIADTADLVFLIGPLMKKFALPVLEDKKIECYSFENFSESKDKIRELIKENDVILVKGSQNKLLLERAVEMLLENPEDKDKLCRRGGFWDKRRKETL